MIPDFRARLMMRFILVWLLFSIPIAAFADCQVTLQWDANDSDPEGYRLFVREEGQDFDYQDFWWQGDYTFQQCTLTGLDENTTYYFVVRAYEGDDLSADSNEIRFNYNDNSLQIGDSNSSGSDEIGAGCFIQSMFP